jgi:hypothetical protein
MHSNTLHWLHIAPKVRTWSQHNLATMQDRLVDEAGINAIICLQSDVCHDALQIGCVVWRHLPCNSCLPVQNSHYHRSLSHTLC